MDYTDLKRRLEWANAGQSREPSAAWEEYLHELTRESAAAIATLEADVEKLTQVLAEHGIRAKKFSGTVGDNVFTNCWFFNDDRAALADQPAEGGK